MAKLAHDDWITTTEAAQASGYHSEHVRELIREGKVKAQRFGTVWQVSRKSLLSYVSKQGAKGARRGRKKASGA